MSLLPIAAAPGIRLHMLALPHTITRPEFSHCAFTGKVLRFAPMMRSRGYEVYHYGVATSESGADVQIDVLSLQEWKELRVKSYLQLNKVTEDEAAKILSDEKLFIGTWATMAHCFTKCSMRVSGWSCCGTTGASAPTSCASRSGGHTMKPLLI